MVERAVQNDIVNVFKEHLILTEELNQGVVIESCEPFDPKLKGHKIVLPERNFEAMRGTLLALYPIFKVDINSAFNKKDPVRIKSRLKVLVNANNTTFTESLITYCGGVDEMFGLFKGDKKKKEEQRSFNNDDLEIGRNDSRSVRGGRDDRDNFPNRNRDDYDDRNRNRDNYDNRDNRDRDSYDDRNRNRDSRDNYDDRNRNGYDDRNYNERSRNTNDDLIDEDEVRSNKRTNDNIGDRGSERAYEEDRIEDEGNEDVSSLPPARQIKKLNEELHVYKNRLLDITADLDEKREECEVLRKEKQDAEITAETVNGHLKTLEDKLKDYDSLAIKCEALESNEKATSLALEDEREKREQLKEHTKTLEDKVTELGELLKAEQNKPVSIEGFTMPRTLDDNELRGVFTSLVTCDPTTLKNAFISMCSQYDKAEEYTALYKIAGDLSEHIRKVSGHSGF